MDILSGMGIGDCKDKKVDPQASSHADGSTSKPHFQGGLDALKVGGTDAEKDDRKEGISKSAKVAKSVLTKM